MFEAKLNISRATYIAIFDTCAYNSNHFLLSGGLLDVPFKLEVGILLRGERFLRGGADSVLTVLLIRK